MTEPAMSFAPWVPEEIRPLLLELHSAGVRIGGLATGWSYEIATLIDVKLIINGQGMWKILVEANCDSPDMLLSYEETLKHHGFEIAFDSKGRSWMLTGQRDRAQPHWTTPQWLNGAWAE